MATPSPSRRDWPRSESSPRWPTASAASAAAVSLAEKRAGSQFDPELAAAFCTHAEVILDGLDAGETWDAVIGAEPSLGVYLSPADFDAALLAIVRLR